MQGLEQWIVGVADQWWVHLVVAAFACVDGFFPTVPSESLLVALGSLSSSTGIPALPLLILAGWAGAFAGDQVAYAIGRFVPWKKLRVLREGKIHGAISAAEHGLERHAFVFFVTARFIPLGRTAVNLTAGAVHYPPRAFVLRIAVATGLWSAYSAVVGYVSGQWFETHPLLGIVGALLTALVASLAMERVARVIRARLHSRRAEPAEAPDASDASVPSESLLPGERAEVDEGADPRATNSGSTR